MYLSALYIALIQCLTVGFASVIISYASMTVDFAKGAAGLFQAGLFRMLARF